MLTRRSARSITSGSQAALRITVSPSGQAGRHEDVLGTGDRDHVEIDLRPLEPIRLGLHVPVLDHDAGAHLLESREVKVDGPGPDRAAAGKGDPGSALPGHEGAEDQHGGAHGLHEIVGSLHGGQSARLDLQGSPHPERDVGAEGAQHPPHGADVPHLGHVAEGDLLVGEKGGAEIGQRRVLGPRDAHGPLEGPSPDHADPVHREAV